MINAEDDFIYPRAENPHGDAQNLVESLPSKGGGYFNSKGGINLK